jgi:hypothetical protein
MKIAKVIHHGQTRYRVNDPSGPDGKRQRNAQNSAKFRDGIENSTNLAKINKNERQRKVIPLLVVD